jgi:hypothetical protein
MKRTQISGAEENYGLSKGREQELRKLHNSKLILHYSTQDRKKAG